MIYAFILMKFLSREIGGVTVTLFKEIKCFQEMP